MRIVQVADSASPTADPGRMEALERIAKSILQRIEDMEERIKALEESPKKSSFPAVTGGESISRNGPPTETFGGDVKNTTPATLDTSALKKNLFPKMWKYLNDPTSA